VKDKRKAYEEKLDVQFEEWKSQIALLKAKADKAKAWNEVKTAYHKTVSKFK